VCRRSVEVEDRDRQEMLPRYGLRRVACKDEFGSPGATKQPDGQISKSLSTPFCKNISLHPDEAGQELGIFET